MIGRPPIAPSIRFWRLVEKTETCWIWRGKKHRGGYGHFNDNRGGIYVHRFAYEEVNGPIPPNLTIDHLCLNRACVRPSHLEAVSMRENILRGSGHAARNILKTHCRAGHPFEGRNLIRRGTERICRICFRAAQRRCWRKRHATPEERWRGPYNSST